MKNGHHLQAAGFTELQHPFLKSVEDSVSSHIDGSFGDFYLEHIVILRIVPGYSSKKGV